MDDKTMKINIMSIGDDGEALFMGESALMPRRGEKFVCDENKRWFVRDVTWFSSQNGAPMVVTVMVEPVYEVDGVVGKL